MDSSKFFGGDQKASAAAAVPAAKQFGVDRSKMFDLAQTQVLGQLFAVRKQDRGAGWTEAFFLAMWNASLELAQPQVFRGPDSFWYVRLHLPQPGEPFASNSVANLAGDARDRAHGIAIFGSPAATEPEYVLTMGKLDSLLTYDSTAGDPIDVEDVARSGVAQTATGGLQTITMQKETNIYVGSPANTFLPPHTGMALYRHLTEGWKIAEPRVSLLFNQAMAPTRSLVINRKLSEFPSAEVAEKQCGYLLWYLPPLRSIMLMPENWKQEDMRLLSEYLPK